MTVSVVIPHFWKERNKNILPIVKALTDGTVPPKEIIIWNNTAPMDIVPLNVRVIQSPFNIGCKARFLAAMCATGDYILFHDNDLKVHPHTIELLVKANQARPMIVACGSGRILNHTTYARSQFIDTNVFPLTAPLAIDISFGRCELVPRVIVNKLLADIPFEESTVMDDIWFSYAAAKNNIGRWVIPTEGNRGYDDFDEEGIGMMHKNPNNFEQRNALCSKLFPPQYV